MIRPQPSFRLSQRSFLTSTSAAASAGDRGARERASAAPAADVHYQGPLSKTHKLLKVNRACVRPSVVDVTFVAYYPLAASLIHSPQMVSLSNTAIAFAAAPAIIHFADNISYLSRVGLSSTLVIFGVLTTGKDGWCTQFIYNALPTCQRHNSP